MKELHKNWDMYLSDISTALLRHQWRIIRMLRAAEAGYSDSWIEEYN